jgi:gamma-glutamylaminecyclotransferase
MTPPPAAREHLLFAYGSLREGEPDHDHLDGAEHLGVARTRAEFYLVELRGFPALVAGGRLEVVGDVYRLGWEHLLRLDVLKEVPRLFGRTRLVLADGRTAHAYTMRLDQVAGLRRLRVGDWRARFAPRQPPSRGGGGWRLG